MNIHPSTVVWGVIWLITTSFTFLWVNFWFNYCDWIDLNRKIHENIDVGDRNYAGGLAAFFLSLLAYCILVFVWYIKEIWTSAILVKIHILNKLLIIWVLSFDILIQSISADPRKTEFTLNSRNLQSFVPFLQFIALVILAAIIVPLCDAGLKLFKFSQTFLCIPRFRFWAYLLFILPLIVFLFSIPMWFDSAHIVNHLPNKPKFIAHRGDPRYAPENTMASYRSAIEIESVAVLESDVMISFDGVPFLMHDHDLKRTTNVEEIFPYRQGEDPSQFTMNELSQLEAGSHFSPSFLHEKIPTLEELLKFAVFENVSVMWDLKQPSPNHPYFSQNIQLVIDIIKRTKSASHVIWLVSTSYPGSTADSMSFVDEVAKVKSQLSGIRLAVSAKFIQKRLNPSFVRSLGMNIVNCENLISNEEIQAYKNEGLEVITYVANSESLFSQMWCLGVDMVTTERFRKFTLMTKPNWYRNKQQDIIICVLIEAQVLIVMAIQAFFYLRSNGIQFFSRVGLTEIEKGVHKDT